MPPKCSNFFSQFLHQLYLNLRQHFKIIFYHGVVFKTVLILNRLFNDLILSSFCILAQTSPHLKLTPKSTSSSNKTA